MSKCESSPDKGAPSRASAQPRDAQGLFARKTTEDVISRLQALKEWRRRACDTGLEIPADPKIMSDVANMVVQAILDKSHATLMSLRSGLFPLASDLADALIRSGVTDASVQAAEVGELAAIVGAAIVQLEVVRPEDALGLIKHGRQVLNALGALEGEATLEAIGRWVGELPGYAEPLTTPTVSRVLHKLERTGFIRREGMTNARRFLLLPSGRAMLDKDAPKPKSWTLPREDASGAREAKAQSVGFVSPQPCYSGAMPFLQYVGHPATASEEARS
uniref:Uncharacterized protein n=1 Tax=Desulfovibrio sp. U5L TaxID=596152 RepID=I2PZ23_9BACT